MEEEEVAGHLPAWLQLAPVRGVGEVTGRGWGVGRRPQEPLVFSSRRHTITPSL